jgi:replicative DNA helicase
MIDIQLLRLMRTRADYNKVRDTVQVESMEAHTAKLIKAIDRYYKTHDTHDQLDFSVFIPFMERTVYPKMQEEDREVYRAIVKNMIKGYPDDATRARIIHGLQDHNLAFNAFNLIENYNAGADIDIAHELQVLMDKRHSALDTLTIPEVSENIDHLLDAITDDSGVKWRLACLQKSMRPLRGGDFGIIAARPDQGKTSFIASEVSYMAPQVEAGRPVMWLNNEGMKDSLQLRIMQAALNCTMTDLWNFKQEGTLYTKYWEAVGGQNHICIFDIHGWTYKQVENLIKDVNPSLIIYDMIDNIKGFGAAARTDLGLELMYQWARECAVKYNTISIATSQISSDGADTMFPNMGHLKDSKTGKQGACDFQIMIGSMENDPQFQNTRWLSAPKNKLRMPNAPRLQHQVVFDRDRARYRDLEPANLIKE